MELRQLRYFIAVAEERHFTRAAERVFLTQQSLSEQIRKLEERVGVALLTRSTRSVELTDAGTALLEDARRVVALADTALSRARKVGRGEVGRLELAFTAPAMLTVLPDALRHFRAGFPDVEVTQVELCTRDQVQALLERRVQVGFLHLIASHPQLETAEIMRERFVLAVPATHPLAGKRVLEPSDLALEPWILAPLSEAPRLRERFLYACRALGFEPIIGMEMQPQSAQLTQVARGVGIALVTESIAHTTPAGLVFRELPLPPELEFALPLQIAVRRDAGPLERAFVKAVLKSVQAKLETV